MLDKGLNIDNTIRNIQLLQTYTRMNSVQILYWDWTMNTILPDKASPSDYGKRILEDIMRTELVEFKEQSEELVV